jgi:hypothetical protein
MSEQYASRAQPRLLNHRLELALELVLKAHGAMKLAMMVRLRHQDPGGNLICNDRLRVGFALRESRVWVEKLGSGDAAHSTQQLITVLCSP